MNQIEGEDDGEPGAIPGLLEAVYRRYNLIFATTRTHQSVAASGIQCMQKAEDHPRAHRKLSASPHAWSGSCSGDRARDHHVPRPGFYRDFRTKVVPELRSLPSFGSGTRAAPLARKCTRLPSCWRRRRSMISSSSIPRMLIYTLEQARRGIFSLAQLREYTANYLESGGTRPFSEYYTAKYGPCDLPGRPPAKRRLLAAQPGRQRAVPPRSTSSSAVMS